MAGLSVWQKPKCWPVLRGLVNQFKLRWAKKRLTQLNPDLSTRRVIPTITWNQETLEAYEPTLQPYERLADIYHAYAPSIGSDYGSFLSALTEIHQFPFGSVLDLACGTGTVTRQFARRARRVVGLDVSEPMLAKARRLNRGLDHLYFVHGDFRKFSLGETFQAAVCAADSLNYVGCTAELTNVFRSVFAHLDPGGFFVFDALGHNSMYQSSRIKTHIMVGHTGCDFLLFYDLASRVSESRVVFDSGVERHRRISLEPGDIRKAARESGLTVIDHFSTNSYRMVKLVSWRDFYVLRKLG
jgi:SAM-dependent methyltransferase